MGMGDHMKAGGAMSIRPLALFLKLLENWPLAHPSRQEVREQCSGLELSKGKIQCLT